VPTTANSYFEEVGTVAGTGYKLFKRWEHHAMTMLQPDGTIISRDAVASALEGSRITGDEKTISASNWQELGPLAWTNTSGYNPGVGRVTAIAVEPVLQQIIYVGSPGGGLWKSVNAGSSWVPIGDDFSNMSIWSIEIDPINTNTVYIGNSAGDVYRSTDGGGSFSIILNNSNPVTDILINPTDTDEIYAALRYSGLFRTTDGGLTWTEVITAGIEDVMYKPGSTSTVYACGTNFYKSTDSGSSFTQITTGFSATDRMKLAVTSDNSNYVYVVQRRGSGFGYLYRSTNSGTSFSTRVDYTTGNYIGSQASRDMAIAVSNTNANEVHIGGFNMYKSTNGGTSFAKECDWYFPNTISGVYEYVHADIEVMQYINGNIYVGSDGGIFKSTNAGDDFTDLSIGLGIHQFYRINSSASDKYVVAGGAQDNGQNIMGTVAHTWKHWAGADGMDCAVNPDNANIVYGAYQYGTIRKSIDGGTSTTSMVQTAEVGSGNWVTPIAIDPNNGSRIYAGYNDLYRHDNSAISGSWVNTTTGITFAGKLSHIETCPSNSNVIYVASYSQVYKSSNITGAAPTWTTLGSTSGTINDIAVDPDNEDRVVVVTSYGYVYLSTNGGVTWTRIDAGLPGGPVKTAVLDRSPDNGIYVAIDGAVYFKSDAVLSWTSFSTNLPKMRVTEIDLYYGDVGESKIRIGTYGRGLWQSPMYDDAEGDGPGGLTCGVTVVSYPYSQSFDSGFGNWEQGASDDFNWTRQIGGTASSGTGPTGAIDGSHYVYMETSNPNYPTKRAILNSPCFDLNSVSSPEISFSYHMLGGAVGTINLEATTDGVTWSSIWSKTATQGSDWLDATVSLEAYTSTIVKLRFNGVSGTSWQGDICIDKINILGGAGMDCAATISTFPYSQSFESGLGNWAQSIDEDFDWTRQTGGTASSGTGPTGAIDGSYYVYMETSNPNYPTKRAILNSPCFDFSSVTSPEITFSYQMLGGAVGTVHLEASTDGVSWTSVWSKTGSQGSAWQDAIVNLDAYASSVVTFRFNGITGVSWQGDICIDKINVTGVIGPVELPGSVLSDNAESEDDWSIEKISVFPNPTTNMIYIQVPTNGERIDLSLTDLSGKIILTMPFETNDGINLLKISTNDLSNGTYILFIQKGESVLTEKIIIQK
jgi:photosystem II stability/assembly factor-like uncharacterized protein